MRTQTHTQAEATWQKRQKLEGWDHKPRDICGHQKLEEAGKISPSASGGARSCQQCYSRLWPPTWERTQFCFKLPVVVLSHGSHRNWYRPQGLCVASSVSTTLDPQVCPHGEVGPARLCEARTTNNIGCGKEPSQTCEFLPMSPRFSDMKHLLFLYWEKWGLKMCALGSSPRISMPTKSRHSCPWLRGNQGSERGSGLPRSQPLSPEKHSEDTEREGQECKLQPCFCSKTPDQPKCVFINRAVTK